MADPRRRRTFGPLVLLGLAAGALAAVGGDRAAVTAHGVQAGPTALAAYDAHVPLVTALALVVLAAWGVVLVTRGRVRRVVAGLGVVASAGAVVAALAAYSQVPDQYADDLAQVGVTNPDLAHTAWYWAMLAATVVSLVATALAVAWAPAWPEMGSRYDAPAGREGGRTTEDDAPTPPEETSNLDLWKALDEGHDPTARDPEQRPE